MVYVLVNTGLSKNKISDLEMVFDVILSGSNPYIICLPGTVAGNMKSFI